MDQRTPVPVHAMHLRKPRRSIPSVSRFCVILSEVRAVFCICLVRLMRFLGVVCSPFQTGGLGNYSRYRRLLDAREFRPESREVTFPGVEVWLLISARLGS